MSPADPHAPTPAGPDPDEPTVAQPVADPFAPPVAEPTPTVTPAAATTEVPVGSAAPVGDWLAPDAVATPEPDPLVRTPDAFTPLGTPEPGAGTGASPADKAQEAAAKAQAFAETSEGKVALAFAGGIVLSFVLKGLGR